MKRRSMLQWIAELSSADTVGAMRAWARTRLPRVGVLAQCEGLARVATIPVERPMRFEFLLNMKTLNALDLVVPNAYRVGAEEVGN